MALNHVTQKRLRLNWWEIWPTSQAKSEKDLASSICGAKEKHCLIEVCKTTTQRTRENLMEYLTLKQEVRPSCTYTPCLHISLRHCCCTFINSQQSIGRAKPLELFTAISIRHVKWHKHCRACPPSNATFAWHYIFQNAEKFIMPEGASRWAGEGGDTSHRADDSGSPEKLGPLSSYGLQKAGTHNLGLCCRVYCWRS